MMKATVPYKTAVIENGGIPMKSKILVVEDEAAINDLITISLETAGYEVHRFYDGSRAEQFLCSTDDVSCDLALLDIMLPGRNGFELLPYCSKREIPVIFLTAKGEVGSKVKGLKEGAEDYIVKPFEILELLVRIEKVLERHQKNGDEIRIGDVTVYVKERRVMKGEEELILKPMEFDCLMLFIKNKNIALTREQILNELWGVQFEGETRTVDVHVARIRKKLGWQDMIRTVPRIGYRLEVGG